MGLSISYTLKDFDGKKIIDKYGMQENGDTQLFLANTCFRRMQKYVPFDTGTLSTHATVRPRSVTYEEQYAHKQYTTNKGKGIRGKYWDKRMVSAEKELIVKEVEAYAKKMKGNK
jgi:hypothetical protein